MSLGVWCDGYLHVISWPAMIREWGCWEECISLFCFSFLKKGKAVVFTFCLKLKTQKRFLKIVCLFVYSLYNRLAMICIQGVPNESWRITHVNENYEVADSYPTVVSNVVGTSRVRSFSEMFSHTHVLTPKGICIWFCLGLLCFFCLCVLLLIAWFGWVFFGEREQVSCRSVLVKSASAVVKMF